MVSQFRRHRDGEPSVSEAGFGSMDARDVQLHDFILRLRRGRASAGKKWSVVSEESRIN
jgi:hypothetical protein